MLRLLPVQMTHFAKPAKELVLLPSRETLLLVIGHGKLAVMVPLRVWPEASAAGFCNVPSSRRARPSHGREVREAMQATHKARSFDGCGFLR